MAISSRLAELNRKYGTAGGGQAEKQSAARKAGTVSARLAALQQRTAQNGSVSAKSQSADAQYLRGDRKPPAPTGRRGQNAALIRRQSSGGGGAGKGRIYAAHDGAKKGGAGGRRGAEERRPAPDRRGETGGEKSICSGDRQKRGVFRAEPVQQRAGKYP